MLRFVRQVVYEEQFNLSNNTIDNSRFDSMTTPFIVLLDNNDTKYVKIKISKKRKKSFVFFSSIIQVQQMDHH
jgi:hypothetical protein